jgi:hypothetical protein
MTRQKRCTQGAESDVEDSRRKTRTVFFRISGEEYTRLERLAKLQAKRISELARMSLSESLNKLEEARNNDKRSVSEQCRAVRLEIRRLTAEITRLLELCEQADTISCRPTNL